MHRLEQIPISRRRQRHAGGRIPLLRIVRVRHGHGAVVSRNPHHLGCEEAFGPDVVKGVRADDRLKDSARKGQRRVGIAADRLAARSREAAGEPQLREIQIGDDRRCRRQIEQRSRQMPRAAAHVDRAAAALERRRSDGAHDRVGDDVGRVGKAIEKITTFESSAECVDRVAVRGVRRRRDLLESSLLAIVFEAEHLFRGRVRPSCLHELARGHGCRLEMHDRDSGDDGEDAAMAAEDAVDDVVAVAPMEVGVDELEASAAERAAEDIESFNPHRGGVLRGADGDR